MGRSGFQGFQGKRSGRTSIAKGAIRLAIADQRTTDGGHGGKKGGRRNGRTLLSPSITSSSAKSDFRNCCTVALILTPSGPMGGRLAPPEPLCYSRLAALRRPMTCLLPGTTRRYWTAPMGIIALWTKSHRLNPIHSPFHHLQRLFPLAPPTTVSRAFRPASLS